MVTDLLSLVVFVVRVIVWVIVAKRLMSRLRVIPLSSVIVAAA
jgi:hypothetical protein